MRLRVQVVVLGTLTLRLAETLVVAVVTAPGLGRLLSLRVKGQNSVLVNLPRPLARDDELTLTVDLRGRLSSTRRPSARRSRSGQDTAIRERGRSSRPSRALLYTQPQLLVSAVDGHRLRDGDAAPDGARQARRASPRGVAGDRQSGAASTAARRRAPRSTSSSSTQPARYLAVALTRLESLAALDIVGQRRRTTSEVGPAPASAPVAAAIADAHVMANPRQDGPRPRASGAGGDDPLASTPACIGDLPYPTLHAGARRRSAAGRPQPGLFRAAATSRCRRRRSRGATIR